MKFTNKHNLPRPFADAIIKAVDPRMLAQPTTDIPASAMISTVVLRSSRTHLTS